MESSTTASLNHVEFKNVTGVGHVRFAFDEQPQRAYVMIGQNGIGKTKSLEALFQLLLFSNESFAQFKTSLGFGVSQVRFQAFCFPKKGEPNLIFSNIFANQTTGYGTLFDDTAGVESLFENRDKNFNTQHFFNRLKPFFKHNTPVVYIGTHGRGHMEPFKNKQEPNLLGDFKSRQHGYFAKITLIMHNQQLTQLGVDGDIRLWFALRASSANPYQVDADNRSVEIETVLRLMHLMDNRIDPDFMRVDGQGDVFLKLNGQKCELGHLSTGFSSILKLIQAIVSGYGYYTNEVKLQNVPGIVLIDEIESHLHSEWQVKIIPFLKQAFPNTTFYVTTHSPLVISQLKKGEAYKLVRDDQAVVSTQRIENPSNAAFADMLDEAFGVDLNALKVANMSGEAQQAAKKALLALLKGEQNG